jgi:hypothetical protein
MGTMEVMAADLCAQGNRGVDCAAQMVKELQTSVSRRTYDAGNGARPPHGG